MAKPKRQSLGKGLGALFEDNHVADTGIHSLRISEIEPNQNQPRREFEEKSLRELADSIETHGVLQPLVVRPLDSGNYQIVAGERRWRASRLAGLSEVPVVVKELNDSETLQLAIIENLQREDLNPMELAHGYRSLMEEYGYTQEQVANTVGKSRSLVANTLRLLNLPTQIMELVQENKISQGHARALLGIEDAELLLEAADRILREDLSVRAVEKIAQDEKEGKFAEPSAPVAVEPAIVWGEDTFFKELELALTHTLGRKVTIEHAKQKGSLRLEFYNKEDLTALADQLTER